MQKTMMRKGIVAFAAVCVLFVAMTVTTYAQVTPRDTGITDPGRSPLVAPENVKASSGAVNSITLEWNEVGAEEMNK
ncbi:MAG: hypothetical protein V8R80_07820 [Eubacterium sp.]